MRQLKDIMTMTILVFFSQVGLSQTIFKYGPELGLSFSQFPKKESYKDGSNVHTIKTLSVYSPILGFNCQLTIRKHLQLTSGLQYLITGTRDYHHIDGRYPGVTTHPAEYYYTSDHYTKRSFQKICLPLTVGYSFIIGSVKPSLFLGFRPNFILTGNYYHKSVSVHTDNTNYSEWETEYNPFDPDEVGMPAKRISYQCLGGISATIKENFSISFVYNIGFSLTYVKDYDPDGGDVIGSLMRNTDIGMSLTYFLKPLKKKKDLKIKMGSS